MTNPPSPTDEDRELIERLRKSVKELDRPPSIQSMPNIRIIDAAHEAADRLESLLSDRAKLELQVQELLTRYP